MMGGTYFDYLDEYTKKYIYQTLFRDHVLTQMMEILRPIYKFLEDSCTATHPTANISDDYPYPLISFQTRARPDHCFEYSDIFYLFYLRKNNSPEVQQFLIDCRSGPYAFPYSDNCGDDTEQRTLYYYSFDVYFNYLKSLFGPNQMGYDQYNEVLTELLDIVPKRTELPYIPMMIQMRFRKVISQLITTSVRQQYDQDAELFADDSNWTNV
jgi:hypothetical protein